MRPDRGGGKTLESIKTLSIARLSRHESVPMQIDDD
jgi:hypothetical protein